jgi:hypothetical protein
MLKFKNLLPVLIVGLIVILVMYPYDDRKYMYADVYNFEQLVYSLKESESFYLENSDDSFLKGKIDSSSLFFKRKITELDILKNTYISFEIKNLKIEKAIFNDNIFTVYASYTKIYTDKNNQTINKIENIHYTIQKNKNVYTFLDEKVEN